MSLNGHRLGLQYEGYSLWIYTSATINCHHQDSVTRNMTFPKSECEKKSSDAAQTEEGMFSSRSLLKLQFIGSVVLTCLKSLRAL